MVETLARLNDMVQGLIVGVAVTGWLIATVGVAAVTRSVLRAAGTFIVGALLCYGIANATVFRDRAGEDLGAPAAAVVDAP